VLSPRQTTLFGNMMHTKPTSNEATLAALVPIINTFLQLAVDYMFVQMPFFHLLVALHHRSSSKLVGLLLEVISSYSRAALAYKLLRTI
jgi:hypothetical protein